MLPKSPDFSVGGVNVHGQGNLAFAYCGSSLGSMTFLQECKYEDIVVVCN